MLQNAATVGSGGPKRILTLPENGPIFGYWIVFLQILGPFTLFLGTNKEEAGGYGGGNTPDGLQFTQNNTNNGEPYQFLWKGELWASASANNSQFILVVPGMEKPNLPC